MTRDEVCRRIEEIGIVPVVRAKSARRALHAVEALVSGGIPVVEMTLTVPDALAVMRKITAQFGRTVLVGAGTVCSGKDARATVEAGAQFVVSPGLDAEVIQTARALDVPVIPGALTPTEVMAASRAGVDWVKLFPCSALGGAKYLRSLRGPFPQLRAIPTGGVSLATVADYIAAGAVAVGVGSELVDETSEYAQLRDRALAFVASVREARAKTTASSHG